LAKSQIQTLVSRYESYRSSTLNLIPSENILSPDLLKALASPMAGRYAGRPETYGGSELFHEIWNSTEELSRQVFKADFASAVAVSGHVAGIAVIDSICKRGEKIATISADCGGYKGYNEGFIPSILGLEVNYLPFDRSRWNIDQSKVRAFLELNKPSLVILGATVFLFPHPVREISEIVHSYGGKVIYDGSHVLGLIAGGTFQDPLREGADILLGSTHKTFFGPQGGIILTNDERMGAKIADRFLYTFVDNFHLNRVAALGIALEEIKTHGNRYAQSVVKNSRTLATKLDEEGVNASCKEEGFTKSHQVFLNYETKGEEIRDKLEMNAIISDSRVRLGTNEVTRRGMKEKEMTEIATLVSESILRPENRDVRGRVRRLVSRFRQIHFTLSA
jgi:glycine hydroxymethyltransferase